jgi:hypothetical protein
MNSPLLALLTRSLREEARAPGTYWARGALAGFILLVGVMIAYWTKESGMSGVEGGRIFEAVVWLQWLAITLAGATWFSSAIAGEKEDDTLGLLRMTNLDALSILLGKSTSRLCSALLLLIAPFPFLFMTVTFGGVSLGQVQAVYVTLAAYTFLLGNVALLWSVIMPTTVRAMIGTAATLSLFYFAPSLIHHAGSVLVNFEIGGRNLLSEEIPRQLVDMAKQITPLSRLAEIMGTGYRGAVVGWQVWGYLAVGVLCFFFAWWGFTYFADRAQEGAPAAQSTKASPGLERAPRSRGNRRRRSRPWRSALAWKDFHFHAGGPRRLYARLAVYGVVIFGLVAGSFEAEASSFTGLCFTYTPVAFCVEIAIVASRIFRWELNEQTWSSLALLPLGIPQITWRKLSGSLLALLPVLLAMLTWLLLVGSNAWDHSARRNVDFSVLLGAAAVALQAVLLTILLIASFSLRLRRGALPLGLAIGFIMEVVILYTVMMLYAFGGMAGSFTRLRAIIGFGNAALLVGNVVLFFVVLRRAGRMAEEE